MQGSWIAHWLLIRPAFISSGRRTRACKRSPPVLANHSCLDEILEGVSQTNKTTCCAEDCVHTVLCNGNKCKCRAGGIYNVLTCPIAWMNVSKLYLFFLSFKKYIKRKTSSYLFGSWTFVGPPHELHEHEYSEHTDRKRKWSYLCFGLVFPLRPCNLVHWWAQPVSVLLASVSLRACVMGMGHGDTVFPGLSALHGWSISLKTNCLAAFLAPGERMGTRDAEPCVLFSMFTFTFLCCFISASWWDCSS